MKKIIFLIKPILSAIFLFLFSQNTILLSQPNLTNKELTLLKVAAGINYTFQYSADEIWPGYDLSKKPYIAYLPDEWVLYLNANNVPEGFGPYPSDWPDLGTTTFIHYGVYKDLVGQFAFDFQIDSLTTFAMGLPKNLVFSFDNPSFMLLSTTIHEGFHQFQHDHFGEIPWAREEKYPILDTENTALASLEMHILKDALKAMFDKNQIKMEEFLKQFVAVRNYRWKHSDSYIRKYEQGQEINEGTARYVEMKSIECFLKLDYTKINNALLTDIEKDLTNISIEDLLIEDMESRLTGISIAPEDMLRNRIYPIGAFLGFLLDDLKIDWKMDFQAAGSNISFPNILMKYFDLDTAKLADYFVKAKTNYPYEKIYLTSKNLINDYLLNYENALKDFDNQQGTRIEINVPTNGLRRFRSSKEKKWVAENGKITLCLNYNLYSLKNKNLKFEINNKALFDKSDWGKNRKNVVFFINEIFSVILDDTSISLTSLIARDFSRIKITGDDFKFEANNKGNFSFDKNIIKIYIE